jgi:hypothetical protein
MRRETVRWVIKAFAETEVQQSGFGRAESRKRMARGMALCCALSILCFVATRSEGQQLPSAPQPVPSLESDSRATSKPEQVAASIVKNEEITTRIE